MVSRNVLRLLFLSLLLISAAISSAQVNIDTERTYLGMTLVDLDEETAERLNLPAPIGVWVRSAAEGYPAHEAGIRPGDVVFLHNGVAATNARELIADGQMTACSAVVADSN